MVLLPSNYLRWYGGTGRGASSAGWSTGVEIRYRTRLFVLRWQRPEDDPHRVNADIQVDSKSTLRRLRGRRRDEISARSTRAPLLCQHLLHPRAGLVAMLAPRLPRRPRPFVGPRRVLVESSTPSTWRTVSLPRCSRGGEETRRSVRGPSSHRLRASGGSPICCAPLTTTRLRGEPPISRTSYRRPGAAGSTHRRSAGGHGRTPRRR